METCQAASRVTVVPDCHTLTLVELLKRFLETANGLSPKFKVEVLIRATRWCPHPLDTASNMCYASPHIADPHTRPSGVGHRAATRS